MWLINVESRNLEEFVGAVDRVPHYAALSHTWEEGQEVSFQEYRLSPTRGKTGYRKIDMACQQAARDKLQYVWVDTCCIDKSSSAELSEAINSMFNWYKRSAQCYVYLRDLFITPGPGFNKTVIAHCVWFSRGWTLQELIAPSELKFYNQDWDFCFTKSSARFQLSAITGVDIRVLNHDKALNTLSVAQKMSWAAMRRTTRIEDIAYCMLGIFDINMPLLYGEEEKAFSRLQEEIIRSCPDPSIFSWISTSAGEVTTDTLDLLSGVLAPSPRGFHRCGRMDKLPARLVPEFSMTNRGIKLRANFGQLQDSPSFGSGYILPVCRIDTKVFAIQTRNIGGGCFVRQDPTTLVKTLSRDLFHRLMLEPYLLTQLPNPNITQRMEDIRLSRGRCLQVQLPRRSMELYRRWPWQQWDEVDQVFFSPGEPDGEWSALKVVAAHPTDSRGDDHVRSLDFLFYAFNWSKTVTSPPRCVIHRVSGGLHDRYLEDMNDRAVTEGWDPYWVSHRLHVADISGNSIVEGDVKNGYTTLVTFKTDLVHDQQICADPFWRVTFDLQVVHVSQADR